jgi:hypothetical protein
MKKRMFVLVVTIVMLVLCANCQLSSGPGKTVKNFYSLVEAGEIDQALTLLSNKMLRSIGKDKLKSGFAQETRRTKERGGINSMEITKEDVVGESGEVNIKLQYGNGEKKADNVKLIKENGDWKIDMSK